MPNPAAGTGLGGEAHGAMRTPQRGPGVQFPKSAPGAPGKRLRFSPQGAKRPGAPSGTGRAVRVRLSGVDAAAEEEAGLLVEDTIMADAASAAVGEGIAAEIAIAAEAAFSTFMGVMMGPEILLIAGAGLATYGLSKAVQRAYAYESAYFAPDPLGLGDMYATQSAKNVAYKSKGYHFDNSPTTLFKSIKGAMANSNPIGLPKTKKVKHAFSSTYGSITRGADALADAFIVYANSLENPLAVAADSHNALLYDQMVDLYERYYVTECTIRVDYFHEGGTTEGAIVGIAALDDTTPLTVAGHYQEVGNTVWKPITPGEHQTIIYAVNCSKFFGTKTISSDNRLQVTAGGDGRPSDEIFFHVYGTPLSEQTATAAYKIHCMITLEYTAVWFDPKSVAQSVAA